MSDSRHDEDEVPTMPSRRAVLEAGALFAAAPLVGGVAARAEAAASPAVENGPIIARAYGAASATARVEPLQIERRAVGPHDVLLDVLYCGICHSDIHQARNEWSSIPTTYPCVPGHEIIGRVQAVGNAVTRFKVGDIGGVEIVSTVPHAYPMQPFIDVLALDGALVNVGALNPLEAGAGFAFIGGRKSLAGSMIGGVAETQEVVDYCAARNIKADVELIRPGQINQAFDRVVKKDVRYRFVIDLTVGKKA